MDYPDPIVIVGVPRSGTSMIAGVFAAHEVWTGTCRDPDENNPRGYYENVHVKNDIKRLFRLAVKAGMMPDGVDGWMTLVKQALQRDRYPGGPWLMKHGVLYWPIWHEFKPMWVTVRRPPHDCLGSCISSGILLPKNSEDCRRQNILMQNAQLDCLEKHFGAIRIDADRVIDCDYEQIKEAFEVCGLHFGSRLTETCIDPTLWTHRCCR